MLKTFIGEKFPLNDTCASIFHLENASLSFTVEKNRKEHLPMCETRLGKGFIKVQVFLGSKTYQKYRNAQQCVAVSEHTDETTLERTEKTKCETETGECILKW